MEDSEIGRYVSICACNMVSLDPHRDDVESDRERERKR